MALQLVDLNGAQQGVIMKHNKDKAAPILLFLHGGPGFPAYPLIRAHGVQLEQEFTVCYWDQRGTGSSYKAAEGGKLLTLEQLLADTLELIAFLRKTYDKEKIYVLGHSWGSILGTMAAQKVPEQLHAYIGVGQIGIQFESEKEAYDFLVSEADRRSDERAKRKLARKKFDKSYYQNRAYGAVRFKYTNKYAVGFTRDGYNSSRLIREVMVCPEYRWIDKFNIFAGSGLSYQRLAKEISTINLIRTVPELEVPVFFLHGQYDYQTTYQQAYNFYTSLKAPVKQFHTFSESAHSPFLEEPKKFINLLKTIRETVAS
ncbi:alpha/beta fold hydrolase [Terribacillus sp. JSM ZJ617]|uniref:alpha/beta fold hydrolase n=1 Tax=Terribacillus TaxID=459532 RepID=UPI0035A8DCC8